jgi:hypothetical protein
MKSKKSSEEKTFFRKAGETIGTIGHEIVVGKDKLVETVTEEFAVVKNLIKKKLAKKKSKPKKAVKKPVKKSSAKTKKKTKPVAKKKSAKKIVKKKKK